MEANNKKDWNAFKILGKRCLFVQTLMKKTFSSKTDFEISRFRGTRRKHQSSSSLKTKIQKYGPTFRQKINYHLMPKHFKQTVLLLPTYLPTYLIVQTVTGYSSSIDSQKPYIFKSTVLALIANRPRINLWESLASTAKRLSINSQQS